MDIDAKVLEIEKKIDLLLEQNVAAAAMKEIKTMDSMGRITIPKSFRNLLGIDGESVGMEISLQGDKIILKKDGVYINYEKTHEKSQLDYDELYVKIDGENKKIIEIEDFGKVKPVSTKAKNIKGIIDGGLILLFVLLYVVLCSLEVADWGKFWIIFVAF